MIDKCQRMVTADNSASDNVVLSGSLIKLRDTCYVR
jgi:hypothetical protein